jgi:murein DD-endopeptidase MepM/ murein hydrolase activator NlpD
LQAQLIKGAALPKKIKKTKINFSKIFQIIEEIIEFKFFRHAAITIITAFLFFNFVQYLSALINDYQDKNSKINQTQPIKINIDESRLKIDSNQDIEYIIAKGDTLMKILLDLGVNEKDVFSILQSAKKAMSLRSINVGTPIKINYQIKINYDSNDFFNAVKREVVINKLEIQKSVEEFALVEKKENDYFAKNIKIKLTKKTNKYSGKIENGLFVDATARGASANAVMNMISLYGYDVDFQRDIRKGDAFEILVESFYNEEGKKVKDGDILFSSLNLSSRSFNIYKYEINNRVEYFDEKGNSIKKSLLRTPVNGARISSGFGLRRHPVLGYSKMHKGTDFAAPSGTPIMAAGSGTITYRGRKGSYGNYVQIKHSSEYSTAYAHASRFGKYRLGAKVKQGDIIAYVGTTGRSTGPHLHFEVLYRGKQINPAKVKATSGIRLAGNNLQKFKAAKAEIDKLRKIN